jgi:hypothetical protein
MRQQRRVLEIEDARIEFRNFTGLEGQYNRAGDRNFCIFFDERQAEELLHDGWNVRFLKPKEEGELPQPYMQVAVSFKNIPPRIVLAGTRNRALLSEDMCEILDHIDIKTADVVISPYAWSANGNSGIKAYLKAIYVVQLEDRFASKYADLPEISAGPQPLGGYTNIIDGEIIEQRAIGSSHS